MILKNQLSQDFSIRLSKHKKFCRCQKKTISSSLYGTWLKKKLSQSTRYHIHLCTISRPAIKSSIVNAHFQNVSSWQPHLFAMSESSMYCLSRSTAQRKWAGSAPFWIQSSSCGPAEIWLSLSWWWEWALWGKGADFVSRSCHKASRRSWNPGGGQNWDNSGKYLHTNQHNLLIKKYFCMSLEWWWMRLGAVAVVVIIHHCFQI